MPIPIFAILVLLSGSAFASSGSDAQPKTVIADLPTDARSSAKVDDKPAQKTAPPIRVILPSPYQIRAN